MNETIYGSLHDSPRKRMMSELLDKTTQGYTLGQPNNLRIKLLNENATMPQRNNPTDSGLDLYASEDVIIEPGETAIVKTGVAIALPSGHEAQIRPRSGITAKTKLRVQLDTIDEAYRGELGIIVDNISQFITNDNYDWAWSVADCPVGVKKPCRLGTYQIRKGDKLAQLVIAKYETPTIVQVAELDETDRGLNGFGSSGTQ